MELKVVGNMLENKGIKFLYNKKNPRKEPLFINMDFATLNPQPIRNLRDTIGSVIIVDHVNLIR